MDLAEISHVRYGLLNADRWVEKIVPILDAQIDALDLTAWNGASLRPTVVRALNRLLDQVKEQMTPKPDPGGKPAGFAAQAQAMIVNNMLAGLKPHVPEYADMVLRELGRPENRKRPSKITCVARRDSRRRKKPLSARSTCEGIRQS